MLYKNSSSGKQIEVENKTLREVFHLLKWPWVGGWTRWALDT